VLCCRNEVDSKLLCEEVVYTVDMKSGWRVTRPELNLTEEAFRRLLAQFVSEVASDDRIATRGKNEEL